VSDDGTPQPDFAAVDETGVLRIDEQRGLIEHRKAIAARLQAHPGAIRMLIINPVMAFKDAGIELSPAVANHVLHAIQYPPEVRAERTRLESELKATLGKTAEPTDPTWLAVTVFGQLGVTPLDIGDAQPAYRSSFTAEELAALGSLLPTRGVVTLPAPDPTPVISGVAPVAMSFEPKTVQLLDLDAPVPAFPPAASAPSELSLTDLWFYKDAASVLRPLLSLGIIISSGVAIYSSSQYRKIRDGEAQSELLMWINAVQVPSRSK
jgi:hypothetical protein